MLGLGHRAGGGLGGGVRRGEINESYVMDGYIDNDALLTA